MALNEDRMFDGINALYKLTEKDKHIIDFHLWEVLINERTGERINDFKTFNLNGLYFTLKPSINDGFLLSIKGSLHKWHNNGKDNSNQFYFSELKHAIGNLCSMFNIPSNEINLHGLEIGVNLNVPIPIIKLLKSIVCYKGKPFTQINKTSPQTGFICALHEYELKIYDKGKQSKTKDENLLRFEVKVKKMRFLKNTFKNLSDLLSKEKAFAGKIYLENLFNSIIWTDPTVNRNTMSHREIKQWLYYSNPKTWQEIKGKERLLYHRNKWKMLLNKYGTSPDILPVIISTWTNLFNQQVNKTSPFHQHILSNEANKTSPFHQHILSNEIDKNLTFSPFICNREKVRKIHTGFYKEKSNPDIEKRKCRSCKKDISHQRKESIYCSAKYVGERQAKKCRNKNSNKKRDIKIKISKATAQNRFLAITYIHENFTYTDILHPKEFKVNDGIDKILKIAIK